MFDESRLVPRPPLSPVVWLVAAGIVALQLSAAGRYGIFRDELYYLMCADHPAWGYVDHPPLAMVFLTVWKAVFGDGVLALRIPPALLNGFVALGAGALAREMRGTAAAQALTAVTVAFLPGVLALGGFYSMNPFDVAFWVATAWIVCRLLGDGDRRWWWGLGVVVGLGLLNKYSMVFLGVGLGIGILLSPLRRELLSRNRLIGSSLVLVLVLPHLIWQITNGWPTLEFIRNAHDLKNADLGPVGFWQEQLLMAHPGYLPLWILGVVVLLVRPRFRTWRPLGVAFVVVGLWLSFSKSKPYYLVAAYPMVLAAGAVAVTEWLARWRRVSRVTAVVLPIWAAVLGLAVAPLAIPLLGPAEYVSYEQTLGLRPKNMENNAIGVLPQHFADRFGWSELAAAVAEVVDQLPAADRDSALIFASNYGEYGAVAYYGRDLDLPPVVSGHNSCFIWWEDGDAPAVVVAVGGNQERYDRYFADVRYGGANRADWAMPYESDVPIWICREPKIPWTEIRAAARSAI